MSIANELFKAAGMQISDAGVPDFRNGCKLAGVTMTQTGLSGVSESVLAADVDVLAGCAAAGVVAADVAVLAGIAAAGIGTDLNKLHSISATATQIDTAGGAALLAAGAVIRMVRTFTRSANSGTYTAPDIVVPVGAAVTNMYLESVVAWAGGTATVNVGTAGTADLYVAAWNAAQAAGTKTALKDLAAGALAILDVPVAGTPLTIKSVLASAATASAGTTRLVVEYQFISAAEAAKVAAVRT